MKAACKSAGLILALLSALACGATGAQEFSIDGNRWIEVEVSIFTHEDPALRGSEVFLPEQVSPKYPESLVRLTPIIEGFTIDFSNGATGGETAPQDSAENEAALDNSPYGPEFQPEPRTFRVMDPARDPYIALGPQAARFTGHNRRLTEAPQHRLLYHAVWRQPVATRRQTPAVFIRGGERFGDHNELEGSIRFSYTEGGTVLDANLWLIRFSRRERAGRADSPWRVPPQPFTDEVSQETGATRAARDEMERFQILPRGAYVITEVTHMRQSRTLRLDTLNYLDHPAFGVVVEVRPYQLPEDITMLQ